MIEKQNFLISENESLQRLDHFLSLKTNFNKSQCQKLILEQKVLVNHNPSKKSYLIKPQESRHHYRYHSKFSNPFKGRKTL